MPNEGITLSEQQKSAVEYIGSPALVVAGAGSGKTRTLTAKFEYLVSKGYDPARILAITFTNKAADEMKRRLTAMTGMPRNMFPWVRTFHSACFKIFKKHCVTLGFEPPVQIYATHQQQKIVREIVLKSRLDKKDAPVVASKISRAKNSGNIHAFFDAKPRVANIRLIDLYNDYEKELKARNAVDFDNILVLTRNILRDNREIRDQYRNYFTYILVDEYQDTNNLQEELTRLLVNNGNLFCVGDDWQAIYGFRGSNVNHFLAFTNTYGNARVFRLERNYRSAGDIVGTANRLIDFNPEKMEKECYSKMEGGIVELNEFFNQNDEAEWVAEKIISLNQTGVPYEKIAVIYRTKFCSLSFEKALRMYSIPYKMMGSKGFFERKEIMDIHSYLAAAVFPKDDYSFERIVNTPKRGIGPGTIKKIRALQTDEMGLRDAARKAVRERVMTPKLHKSLSGVLDLLDTIETMRPNMAIEHVVAEVDYLEHLKQYAEAGSMDYVSKEENIKELIRSAAEKDTIVDYLEEASLIQDDTEEDEDKGSGVRLSTIHASKGLEYSAVFIVACEEDILPHWKSKDSESDLWEERRLMYVAMTRAEQFLYISSANFRRGDFSRRSRFMDEIKMSLN